jgi:hypothetical protein
MSGLRCFKIRGKLAPRYIGPFKILEQRGEVAYQLELPQQLSDMHDVFHVFATKEVFVSSGRTDASGRVNSWRRSTYQEYPVKILDTSEKVTPNNHYKMCKVQ